MAIVVGVVKAIAAAIAIVDSFSYITIVWLYRYVAT